MKNLTLFAILLSSSVLGAHGPNPITGEPPYKAWLKQAQETKENADNFLQKHTPTAVIAMGAGGALALVATLSLARKFPRISFTSVGIGALAIVASKYYGNSDT